MISQSIIWKHIADAIEDAADVRACVAEFDKPLRLFIGHQAMQELAQADGPMISISPMDSPVDFGHGVTTRSVPVMVRFAVPDITTTEEMTAGRRVEFLGVIRADTLGLAILAAIKAISGLGDELRQANYYLDSSETWPLVQGRIECVFEMQRTLTTEPTITEI